jgi:anti-anti-sigma factor
MALQISTQDSVEHFSGSEFGTDIRSVGNHALVVVVGEIDVSTVGSLYEQFACLARQGVCHVALDRAGVSFIDSTGISLLVTEHKRAESMRGELIVFSPSPQLRRMIQMVGLDTYFNMRPAVPDSDDRRSSSPHMTPQ